ncbi:hypothetical protein DFJ73DRAFT_822451 [Zopfochytrium polystomum]|nr:hypothetical protein DFJ73DRAFT_822451 [Zopfochytrium polystomum]
MSQLSPSIATTPPSSVLVSHPTRTHGLLLCLCLFLSVSLSWSLSSLSLCLRVWLSVSRPFSCFFFLVWFAPVAICGRFRAINQ